MGSGLILIYRDNDGSNFILRVGDFFHYFPKIVQIENAEEN